MENENEIPKQMVWLTEGNSVVAKAVLDLTDEEHARLRNAEDIYKYTCEQTASRVDDEEMQALIEAVDARHLPADDPTSFAIVSSEMRRKARERREAEIRAADREAHLHAEREAYLRPSDRAQAARQLQRHHEPVGPIPTPPARVWTDAELDAMSAEDMVRHGIVTRSTRAEDRQGSSGMVLRPERTGERRERKIKFSEVELASQESRKQVIDRDKAERRKVKEDIERALDEQREQQERERKKRRGK